MNLNHSLECDFEDEGDEPISLNEAKNWLRVELAFTADDDLISSLITTARKQCEGYLKVSLVEKTVTALLDNSANDIELPYGPVVEFTSLNDSDGNEINADSYTLRGIKFKRLNYQTWAETSPRRNNFLPDNQELTAIYSAGYAADELPAYYRSGILAQLSWLYEQRGDEGEKEMSPSAIVKLKSYRRVV